MATRIEKILQRARRTLADPNQERWTDDDLLLILDEGHKDICRQTQMLHETVDIWLTVGSPFFDLPEDLWLITRASYDDELIPLVSHSQLDRDYINKTTRDFNTNVSGRWTLDEGCPEFIVYDRRNLLEGRVYPIPNDCIVDRAYEFSTDLQNEYQMGNSVYGVFADVPDDIFLQVDGVTSDMDDFGLSSDFGVLTNILAFGLDGPREFAGDELLGVMIAIDDYTASSLYGVAVDLYDPSIALETFNSVYGVVADVVEIKKPLKIQYIKNPKDIVSSNDELDTPYMYDTALKYYVVGHAFLDDLDTEYQAKGAQQLTFYNRELEIAQNTQVRDGTRAAAFETSYRRPF